jgi:hypothetical protein
MLIAAEESFEQYLFAAVATLIWSTWAVIKTADIRANLSMVQSTPLTVEDDPVFSVKRLQLNKATGLLLADFLGDFLTEFALLHAGHVRRTLQKDLLSGVLARLRGSCRSQSK